MVYVFNSTEENLLDYTLPEGVETFQVRAKLFYNDGSPVVDMNGDEVTHVVSDVIRGTAPSVSASGDQAADSLTVGDTASVTVDSTTGTPTPNVNLPPDRRSKVATSRATFCGLLLGKGVTVVPSLIESVEAAIADSVIHGSVTIFTFLGSG